MVIEEEEILLDVEEVEEVEEPAAPAPALADTAAGARPEAIAGESWSRAGAAADDFEQALDEAAARNAPFPNTAVEAPAPASLLASPLDLQADLPAAPAPDAAALVGGGAEATAAGELAAEAAAASALDLPVGPAFPFAAEPAPEVPTEGVAAASPASLDAWDDEPLALAPAAPEPTPASVEPWADDAIPGPSFPTVAPTDPTPGPAAFRTEVFAETALRPEPPAPLRTEEPAALQAAPVDGGEAALRAAIAGASREVIERIAWEVVPQLAEVILREHVERLLRAREGGERS